MNTKSGDLRLAICSFFLILSATGIDLSLSLAETSPMIEHGLIGWWEMDEGRGSVINDKSPNQNHGEVQKAVWTEVEDSGALEFGGEEGGYVRLPYQPYLDLDEELTISAWVYPVQLKVGHMAVLSKLDYPNCGYQFSVDYGTLEFMFRTKDGLIERYGSGGSVPQDTWSHVACVYSLRENRLSHYINGEKVSESPARGKIDHSAKPGIPVTFGAMAVHSNFSTFYGSIKGVKLYARALSDTEIEASYKKSSHVARTKIVKWKKDMVWDTLERQTTSAVEIGITDKDSNVPLNAQVYVKALNGKFYFPKDSFAYGERDKKAFFYAFGNALIKVPPGRTEIVVFCGYEYRPELVSIELKDRDSKKVKIKLKRFISLPEKGWYAGDHHMHLGAAHGQGPYAKIFIGTEGGCLDACKIIQAEGLDWASIDDDPGFQEYYETVTSAGFLPHAGTEVGVLGGHICSVGMEEMFYPSSQMAGLKVLETLNSQGAVGVFSHPFIAYRPDIFDNPDWRDTSGFAWELPMAVALGKTYAWDVLCWETRGDDKLFATVLKDWYRFLNLGFRLAASAGTDTYFASPLSMDQVGRYRCYVRVPNLTRPDIARAYSQGRTFVTDGPLVLFRIGEHEVGDTIYLSGRTQETLRFKVEAYSRFGIMKLEVIRNGEVIKILFPEGDDLIEEFDVKVDETSWFAVRCYGKVDTRMEPFLLWCRQIAHTSPIYVQFGEDKMSAKKEDVDYFLKWLESYKKIIYDYAKAEPNNVNEQDYQELKENLAKAKSIYTSLIVNPQDYTEETLK